MTILTEEFDVQGDFVARSVGMPAIPRVIIEHPVAGTGHENLVRVATEAVPRVLASFAGGTR